MWITGSFQHSVAPSGLYGLFAASLQVLKPLATIVRRYGAFAVRTSRIQRFCAAFVMAAQLQLSLGSIAVRGDEASPDEPEIRSADREHWAFRPLSDPAVPEVQNASWPRSAIDRFILARLEKEGLTPALAADRVTLMRRVTLDLTGLPPTLEEIDAFLADGEPDAYERLIDRLLASPAYGERWGQHWLDLARFADTDGYEHDHVRPNAWRYRDWVINALNADLPYDEFVREQIAGDLLRPGDEDAAVATGFAVCGPDMPDINLQDERRHMLMNEIASTVGSVFLGLQIGCAQCHDHKFDPISQADFYRLRACFDSAVQLEKDKSIEWLHDPENESPKEHFVYARGDFRRPTASVEPGFPRIANPWNDRPNSSAGKHVRMALAEWLARPDHPLTTRVIVNRIWQYHFGEGLTGTPSDFGVMGDEPTHPELLDWLAAELPRRGWRLKELHRLMLTSATYRQASLLPSDAPSAARSTWEQSLAADPDNRLLGRMPRRRLEGEAIRDCMLAASERLSERRGGPGVMPPLPEELRSTLLSDQWKASEDEEDHRRRSIYLFARRNLRYPLFEAFDRPEATASCPRRAQSTIAPQALLLLNSEFSQICARDLADYVERHVGDVSEVQIDLAYRRTLGRHPSTDEKERALAFLAERAAKGADAAETPTSTALTHLCLALFNLNEFVYVD